MIVVVVYRFSIIRDVDQIVVFGCGKVVEVGMYDWLVVKKGVYYEMVLGQLLDCEVVQNYLFFVYYDILYR